MSYLIETPDQKKIRELEHRMNSLERMLQIEPAKWYENIPPVGGVLCWCKDYYTASYKHWIYAEPLTKAEIQSFMDNAPEDL